MLLTGLTDKIERYAFVVLIGAITALAFGLRLHGIEYNKLEWDELSLIYGGLSGSLTSPQLAPLNVYLMRVYLGIVRSLDPWVLHLLPAMISTLVVPAVWWLGKTIFDTKTATLAALMMAVSPAAIRFGALVRPYALLQLVTVCITLFLFLALETRQKRYWLFYGVGVTAGLFTHLVTANYILGAGIGLIFWLVGRGLNRRITKADIQLLVAFIAASLVAGLFGISWFRFTNEGTAVFESFCVNGLATFLKELFFGMGASSHEHISSTPGVFFGALLLGILSIVGLVKNGKVQFRSKVMMVAMVVVHLVILFFTLGQKCTWPWLRYASNLMPIYLLLAASGGATLLKMLHNRFLYTAGAMVLLVCSFGPGFVHWWPIKWGEWESAQFQELERIVDSNNLDMQGLIFAEFNYGYGDESFRSAFGAYLYLGRDLPYFHKDQQRFYRYRFVSSGNGGWTKIPVVNREESFNQLPPGSYGLLTRLQTPECRDLNSNQQGFVETARFASGGEFFKVCRTSP